MEQISVILQQALIDAQLGKIEAAKAAVLHVRDRIDVSRNVATMIEVMVIEGACMMYAGKLDEASDRFKRASVLAGSLGGNREKALAHCWLSLISLNLGRHLDAAKIIVGLSGLLAVEWPLIRFSYASMIAMLAEYAGDRAKSVRWFSVARREASRAGEPKLLSLVLYNIAMLRVGNGVFSAFFSKRYCPSEGDELDLLMARSSENYDAINKVSIQLELHQLVYAFAEASAGRFDTSLALIESLSQSGGELAVENVARTELCKFWCQFELGVESRGFNDLLGVMQNLTDTDDIALAYGLCSRMAEACSDHNAAQLFGAESDMAVQRLQDCKREIRVLLDRVELLGVD
jgi:hypothetical protein